MKIGIDGRLWDESGVGRYIRNLVSELLEIDRKDQYVLFLRDKNRVGPRTLPSNWRLVETDIRWHSFEEQLRMPLILKREKLDLVHFPYHSVPIFYREPFVVTIHDLVNLHFPTGKASTLPSPLYQLKLLGYRFVISQAVKKAKKIIAVSKATKQEISDHLGVSPDKVVVIYEGATLASSNQRLVTSSKITKRYTLDAKRYFLYVGNAYPHKNLDRLLQAFKKTLHPRGVVSQHPSSLVLVGKEDYFYKRLKDKVRAMGIVDNVIFYGEVNDSELTSLYRNAKALILPSLMEGFGLPALEAMENKCLVLASDIASLKETCGDVAIYFNPYDVKDMAKKIKDVIQSDSLTYQSRISDGIKKVRMFSWRRMAEQTVKVYESV